MVNWKTKVAVLERALPPENDPTEVANFLAQFLLATIGLYETDYDAGVIRRNDGGRDIRWSDVSACFLDRPSPDVGIDRIEYLNENGEQRDDVVELRYYS